MQSPELSKENASDVPGGTQQSPVNGPPGYTQSVEPSIEVVPPSQRLARNLGETPEDQIEDKWSDDRFRRKNGSGPEDLRAIGTVRRFGNGKMILMANGPKHATTYRLYKAKSEMATYNSSDLPDLLEDRLGMEEFETPGTTMNGKKSKRNFKYGPEHAKGIQGVAWHVPEGVLQNFPKYFRRAVDLVKPKTPLNFPVTKYDKDGVPTGRMKIVDSFIKIRWERGGQTFTSWESRETARRVFGGPTEADRKIYNAAMTQEMDFDEWFLDPDQDQVREETPWRSGVKPTPERELTPGLVSDRGDTPSSMARSSRARTPGPVSFQEPTPGGKIAMMSRDVWIKDYLGFKEITDPAIMTPQQNADMMQAWRLDSAAMAAA